MITPRLPLALAAVLLAAGALAGCTSTGGSPTAPPTEPASLPADPTDGPLIEPITISVGELEGTTVDLEIGQVLNIDTGDLAVDSYSGTVEDPSIAEFTSGREEDGATFNPGVTGLAEGSTSVTLSNSDGGIQDVTFTVDVSAAN